MSWKPKHILWRIQTDLEMSCAEVNNFTPMSTIAVAQLPLDIFLFLTFYKHLLATLPFFSSWILFHPQLRLPHDFDFPGAHKDLLYLMASFHLNFPFSTLFHDSYSQVYLILLFDPQVFVILLILPHQPVVWISSWPLVRCSPSAQSAASGKVTWSSQQGIGRRNLHL